MGWGWEAVAAELAPDGRGTASALLREIVRGGISSRLSQVGENFEMVINVGDFIIFFKL